MMQQNKIPRLSKLALPLTLSALSLVAQPTFATDTVAHSNSKPIPTVKTTTKMPASRPLKQKPTQATVQDINHFCKALSKKLRTVTYSGCTHLGLHASHQRSVQNRLLTYKEITPNTGRPPLGRVLFISGIHGDEYAAISISYLWLKTLMNNPKKNHFQWLFLPLANPDGLFQHPAQRQNADGVDLNRNFPTPDWDKVALKAWKTHYYSRPRRYPGPFAASEPETKWLVSLIQRYHPDAIISIHTPYGLLDYDGPVHAMPDKIGNLKLKTLGTFPGSLGRYAGETLNIPVLTIELKHSWSLPKREEILTMWADVQKWLIRKVPKKEN